MYFDGRTSHLLREHGLGMPCVWCLLDRHPHGHIEMVVDYVSLELQIQENPDTK